MSQKIVVGLIAAPELPASIGKKYMERIAPQLQNQIKQDVEWEMKIIVDPLTGSAETVGEILEKAIEIKETEEWDYAVCLTDLPLFHETNIVGADISLHHGVAQLSIPVFGWLPTKKRIQNAIIQIIREIYYYQGNSDKIDELEKSKPERILQKQFPVSRVKRLSTKEEVVGKEARYIAYPRTVGRIRLLMGMTQANRPMSIMPSLKSIIAVAFSTGVFGLIFTTIWELSYILSNYRLIALNAAAIGLMVFWIITAHNLWENPSSQSVPKLRRLYNQTTILTLLISVISYYAVLYILFLVAIIVLIPPDVYASSINLEGEFTFVYFLRLAWVATSISTIVGAIGASLENEELVRDITYGYRQKRRYSEIEKTN
ncbi:5,10-methylene-tetrahydrofolate dehydrogenase [Oceanobacillus kapialis]|uniref:5,10-methylene-tetrahydrofolate dehydrogenase n=1 Tax=Oceanobacillus kapialis TaxID=481353 RepID=UPI003850B9D1